MKREEKNWRKFLLGDVSETERAEIEDRFLADDTIFTEIQIAEDDLIEDFLSERLSEREQNLFAREFSTNPQKQARVDFMRRLIEESTARKRAATIALPANTFWEKFQSFFDLSKFNWQIAGAFASVLVLAFGAIWIFTRFNDKTEIAQNPANAKIENTNRQTEIITPQTPEISPVETPKSDANARPNNSPKIVETANKTVPKVDPKKPETPKIEPKDDKSPTSALAFFVLKPNLMRDGKTENRVKISDKTKEIGLQLNLENADFQDYEVRVTTVDGAEIKAIKTRKPKKGKNIYVKLPTANLTRGDYILEVRGIKTGKSESVADFALTLDKPK